MLPVAMSVAEYLFVLTGIGMLMTGIVQYGRRTSDWGGIVKMFYKRIGMTVSEYKWYRLGIGVLMLGIVIRILNLTLWPM
ncbi:MULTISPECIES: hypothetical protein [Photobacterium]|nr:MULTISPECIES: hypothetical protein [Photobacterium]